MGSSTACQRAPETGQFSTDGMGLRMCLIIGRTFWSSSEENVRQMRPCERCASALDVYYILVRET